MNTEPPTGDDLQRMLVSMKQNVLEHAEERHPEPRRHRSRIVIATVALLALGTAGGAVALAVVPQVQQAAPAPSPTAEPSVPASTPASAPVVDTPAPRPSASSAAAPSRYPDDCRALYSDADRQRFFGATPLAQTPAHPDGTTVPEPASTTYSGGTWTAATWLDCHWAQPRTDVGSVHVTIGSASATALAEREDGLRAAGADCAPGDGGTVCRLPDAADPDFVGAETSWWDSDGRWITIDQVNFPTSGLLSATIAGLSSDRVGPGSWVVSGAGVGPITIGSSYQDVVDEVEPVLPQTNGDCPNPNVGFFDSGDLHVIVVQAGGKVVGVDASGLTTAAGMGRGNSIDQLRAAYPDLTRTPGYGDDSSPAFAYWSVRDGDRSVTFEMDEGGELVTGVWVGDDPRPPYEYCG
ncbi:hypothetical protein [Curtobacterium sp. MCBD17_030]|uniref:hypothetical protein n=1 Tax=Curtobacterium sp. MCBD17_030 TaxID=2175649 RepID=UPI000D8FF31D|nr:hypothetical protein [Curtobacterium sp. MCBD17_030]PYY33020.1 hypothetical protein DEI89_11615 [Curtobacterium sp. MCBD17_030]